MTIQIHKKEMKTMGYTPVYMESAEYARDHNELNLFRESSVANVRCRDEIAKAVTENYKDNRLNTRKILETVEPKFGTERVITVIANTLQLQYHDGRYSKSNLAWASHIRVPEHNRYYYALGSTHPGLVNLLASAIRTRELEKIREDMMR